MPSYQGVLNAAGPLIDRPRRAYREVEARHAGRLGLARAGEPLLMRP